LLPKGQIDCSIYVASFAEAKMKKLIAIILMIITLSACDPGIEFIAEQTNTRYQTVIYEDFTIEISMGKMVERPVMIGFLIKPKQEISILPHNLRIYFRGDSYNYKIYKESNSLGNEISNQEMVKISSKGKYIIYKMFWNKRIETAEKITLFGPGLFQSNGQSYNLDSLNFVMPKPRGFYREPKN
jgi:hypothetical protein